jgi:hypothetical protein
MQDLEGIKMQAACHLLLMSQTKYIVGCLLHHLLPAIHSCFLLHVISIIYILICYEAAAW